MGNACKMHSTQLGQEKNRIDFIFPICDSTVQEGKVVTSRIHLTIEFELSNPNKCVVLFSWETNVKQGFQSHVFTLDMSQSI